MQHVFVVTANSAIWRSKDGGSTFEDVTERFKCEDQHAAAAAVKPPAHQHTQQQLSQKLL
jgi:hypothetical protein